jgi:valyl-tRNA synthetase
MDLRPQAHEIIRTWLFATVLRAHQEFGDLPFRTALLSGWILDPDRKKMSKSKGNTVTPMGLLEEYGSDAVRYWAVSGRPGTDTAFDTGQMKVGRRLAIKILNATKFVLRFGDLDKGGAGDVTEPLDRAMLAELAAVVADATGHFEGYDYARALERTEQFFWTFCDDYLELVKERAYGSAEAPATRSAHAALAVALRTLLRLFAPMLPFVTEEAWSWWQDGSVHRAPWPSADEFTPALDPDLPAGLLTLAGTVLGLVRKAKSEARQSMRSEVARLTLRGPEASFTLVSRDVLAAGVIREVTTSATDGPLSAEIELA